MQINLKQLDTGSHVRERSLNFACDLDLSAVSEWGRRPYPEPVHVAGTVSNHLGVLTIGYTVNLARADSCARCLEPVREERELSFTHTIVDRDRKSGEENSPEEADDVFILMADGVLELDELVISDLLLDESGVPLCGPDCLGLCPSCGVNRNEHSCSCGNDADDPGFGKPESPFAALREL